MDNRLIALYIFVGFVGLLLIYFSTSIPHHFHQHRALAPESRDCWYCNIYDNIRKALKGFGHKLGKLRPKILGYGQPVRINRDLPMYHDTGVLTPHVLNGSQREELQLLTIPYEIRRDIYLSFLKAIIALDCLPTWTLRPNNRFLRCTTLLRVCRQTREEYLPLLYNNILFHISPRRPFYNFYRHLDWPAIHGLREVHLTFDRAPTARCTWWRDLADAQNLRELYFTFKHVHVYLAWNTALAMLLLDCRRETRPNLSLVQVAIESPQSMSRVRSEVGVPLSYLRTAMRFWPVPVESRTLWAPLYTTVQDQIVIGQTTLQAKVVGYSSSLEERCREMGVKSPV